MVQYAAYITVGAAIADTALIDYGINSAYGFIFQMNNSVFDDGFWYEGSPAYHAYALEAHTFSLKRHTIIERIFIQTMIR